MTHEQARRFQAMLWRIRDYQHVFPDAAPHRIALTLDSTVDLMSHLIVPLLTADDPDKRLSIWESQIEAFLEELAVQAKEVNGSLQLLEQPFVLANEQVAERTNSWCRRNCPDF